jgi:hypothetical protein
VDRTERAARHLIVRDGEWAPCAGGNTRLWVTAERRTTVTGREARRLTSSHACAVAILVLQKIGHVALPGGRWEATLIDDHIRGST